MNEPHMTERIVSESSLSPSERLRMETGLLAGRMAALLRSRFSGNETPVASALAFLDHAYTEVNSGKAQSVWEVNALERQSKGKPHPLDRLVFGFNLTPLEFEIIILTGMAEEHEGYAEIFRTLHPLTKPHPTPGLTAQLLCQNDNERRFLRELLETGAAVSTGIIGMGNDEPFFDRSLVLADQLWSVLHGIDAWPNGIQRLVEPVTKHGLQEWLTRREVTRAQVALRSHSRFTLLITGDDEVAALHRAVVLTSEAGVTSVVISLPIETKAELERLIQVHASARGAVPIMRLPHTEGPERIKVPAFMNCPGPVIFCAPEGYSGMESSRPLINLVLDRLTSTALRDMWCGVLPEFSDQAAMLAGRYPLEPPRARQVATDLKFLGNNEHNVELRLKDVATSIRARNITGLGGGVRLMRPQLSWHHLILPDAQMTQLREAVDRLYLQAQVLDNWCFLEGRRGARGVRMLFAGPPGTGKTLSAEVLANALDVDLLQVDLSRVVSKWIGETEKNLAEVFETAESAKAVLLFDEADALFGKRTEVSDAHDRYANLETAYLLSRLERYEGLAILSTNLRQNIDTAFTRRLEFIIEFEEPDYEQRLALWHCHLPNDAPLAEDVRLEELAAHFNIVGGLIRNAAVAAAFLAAAECMPISRSHFIRAIRREYDKAGKAYRELPAVADRH